MLALEVFILMRSYMMAIMLIADMLDMFVGFDGFDNCLIGVAHMKDGRKLSIYCREKCIEYLMAKNTWSREDAEEFFEYNIENAYIGPKTPIFLDRQDNQDSRGQENQEVQEEAQEVQEEDMGLCQDLQNPLLLGLIFDKMTDELMRLEVSIDKTLERMERLASYEYGTKDCESEEIGDSLQEHLSNLISASNRLAGVKMGLFSATGIKLHP